MNDPEDDKPHPESEKGQPPAAADASSSSNRTVPIRGSPGSAFPHDSSQAPAGLLEPSHPQPSGAAFTAGEVVANRYKITRFIGHGGMGEVYEAEGLELRERIALKTVRPDIAADSHAIERFKREIQLARRVTHPNVCRIFDLGHHRVAAGGEVTFLTM